MASQTGQRVRLVKCPKCLKILQEDEDVPVYQCGGCSAILQAKRRSIAPNTTPSSGETEGAIASEPRSEPETNNVSSSSRQDTVLPSSPGRSSGQVDEKAQDGSMESTEKRLGGLELSNGEEGNETQLQECSPDDSDKNEGEDSSSRLKSDLKSVTEATGAGTSSGSLSADHLVAARASHSSSDAYNKLEAEISPDASPVEEEQNEDGYAFHPHRESPDDLPANKTSSAYDGSKSSSDEREDQLLDENEQWNALQKIRTGNFEMQRYPESFKEQGASSSSTFSEKRRNGTTTYSERHQNRSLQLEGPGGRLGRQGRRHVTEQLRPNMPFYPRETYTRVSPTYPSHDEFDRYSRAHSLQMPPYAGGMNYESADYMYQNNARARGRGQGSRFSGEMASDRRNHAGWYSGQLHNSYSSYSASPQRPMEQAEYNPRWSHEMVSDVEEHQRNRHAGHHHELQTRRLKERQRVAKRHIRPTAGGAPFVSCYSCSESLQLPVDFLIFNRKHHLLRCGTCTTVLRFSLQSRTHLVPAVTPDANANRSSNSTSESPRDKAHSKPEKASSSAQEEEVPVARGSPLHRLMGYSTVSQVFKASQRPPSV
ncbi:unnamed protein product [Thlaspi arvense]|uniref:Zinc-ribbon domain-containing protein n=1 Tax=Thlaspi arvense TaxID=13288 RepID=A0AAU9SVY7_THLAR|nr:unnamed protein product [Thlaspi arvense]